MSDYNFEEFDAVGGRIVPTINLNIHGFNVSAGFTKKYDLSKVVGVKLFYDQGKKAVGFKFVESEEPGMLKIKLVANKGGGYINSKAFFVKFDIDAKEYQGRYEAKEINGPAGKMFVLTLGETKGEKTA